jgi:hypothetical protein
VLTLGALLFPQDTKTPVVVVAPPHSRTAARFFLGICALARRDPGMSIAIATMATFAKPLSTAFPSLTPPRSPFAAIAWPWYVLIGTVITLLVGILSSYTHPAPAESPASA